MLLLVSTRARWFRAKLAEERAGILLGETIQSQKQPAEAFTRTSELSRTTGPTFIITDPAMETRRSAHTHTVMRLEEGGENKTQIFVMA